MRACFNRSGRVGWLTLQIRWVQISKKTGPVHHTRYTALHLILGTGRISHICLSYNKQNAIDPKDLKIVKLLMNIVIINCSFWNSNYLIAGVIIS